jgi:hypothetical protein
MEATLLHLTNVDNEEADFELALQQLSRDMIRLCYLKRPVTFDWYCRDFLYTNVRFVAVIARKIDRAKWLFPYEFSSLSMGPVIQSRHYFKIRFWNGFYVVFDNDETIPFENDQASRIEEMLRHDDETQTVMEKVRAICESTGVLLSPQFVSLSRMARGVSEVMETQAFCKQVQND